MKNDGYFCRSCIQNAITYNGNEEYICTNCGKKYEREWGEDERGNPIPTKFLLEKIVKEDIKK